MNYDAPDTIPSHINIGCGEDLSIAELSLLVKKAVNYNGNIVWDTSKPDGTPRKLLDVSKLNYCIVFSSSLVFPPYRGEEV